MKYHHIYEKYLYVEVRAATGNIAVRDQLNRAINSWGKGGKDLMVDEHFKLRTSLYVKPDRHKYIKT